MDETMVRMQTAAGTLVTAPASGLTWSCPQPETSRSAIGPQCSFPWLKADSRSVREAPDGKSRSTMRPGLITALERCAIFHDLDRCDLAAVVGAVKPRSFAARTDVFIEGGPCQGLWILVAGRVCLYHSSANGRKQVVSFCTPFSALELGAALDGRAFTATATTLDDAVLVLLRRSALLTLVRRCPLANQNIIDQLCADVRRLDLATAVAGLKDARGRIICCLLQFAQRYGVPIGNGIRISFQVTRQNIADASGVTVETVIRVLGELQRQGVVATRAHVIEIADMARLRVAGTCDDCLLDCGYSGPACGDAGRRRYADG